MTEARPETGASVTRAEVCAVAIAETFRGDGEVLVSPIGLLPQIGARLARASFEPDLLMTDGVAPLLANVLPVSGSGGPEPVIEGWMPYRSVFDNPGRPPEYMEKADHAMRAVAETEYYISKVLRLVSLTQKSLETVKDSLSEMKVAIDKTDEQVGDYVKEYF